MLRIHEHEASVWVVFRFASFPSLRGRGQLTKGGVAKRRYTGGSLPFSAGTKPERDDTATYTNQYFGVVETNERGAAISPAYFGFKKICTWV